MKPWTTSKVSPFITSMDKISSFNLTKYPALTSRNSVSVFANLHSASSTDKRKITNKQAKAPSCVFIQKKYRIHLIILFVCTIIILIGAVVGIIVFFLLANSMLSLRRKFYINIVNNFFV
jgi:hypothetical protein